MKFALDMIGLGILLALLWLIRLGLDGAAADVGHATKEFLDAMR